ncbi:MULTISPECIES: hypothetical protein [Rhodococcus]|uniref:Transmembrane protein n=2 Tax=Rhodococcus TaxID=1827 RepID=M2YMT4_9NOCA|nr:MULTISPECIES: hypothetical protein [Rhodococcus]EME56007.1 hypothetical protein G352_22376 [Rhodococcus ruber BKS 20-38]KOS57566.1 hypothetical protein Z051_03540 [Rhodococcus rhodochrous KG-21]MBC2592473.1 hypothetical protein [Rhodococcus aetherivorans]QSE72467.1 hypothetical protein JYA91_29555 [Rhodococcus sp. PSBB049]
MSLASTTVDLTLATAPSRPPVGTADVLAQQTEVNTDTLRSWIEGNVIFVILILIACALLMGALRANLSKVLTVGGLSVVGLAYLGVASSESAAKGVGNWLLSLLGINA